MLGDLTLLSQDAAMKPTLISLLVLCSAVATAQQSSAASDSAAWVEENMDHIAKLYIHLHMHPELSFKEIETGKRIGDEFRKAGFDTTNNVGGHGVVGILRNGAGPTVMLRADLDALPLKEITGVDYASTVETKNDDGTDTGVMHACGHDIHMTNLVATAQYLAANKDKWSGTLMVIGQPAEERGGGATAMLKDGLFKRFPKPDFALALHVSSDLATGKVGVRAGYAMANVDSVDITMKGRGGHGSAPHTTIDPVMLAAELVVSLQTLVSREIKPLDPAVVTVGSIHGGTKHNIIGDECKLQLTVRSYKDEVRRKLLDGIKRKAEAVAAGANAPEPEVKFSEGTPSLFNNEELAARVIPVFEKVLGENNIRRDEPFMGGEDFSQYGRAGVPIFMYRLGSVNARRLNQYKMAGKLPPSLHSGLYYPDFQEALTTGITTMSAAAMELMKRK